VMHLHESEIMRDVGVEIICELLDYVSSFFAFQLVH
jgi:hypothetical protein